MKRFETMHSARQFVCANRLLWLMPPTRICSVTVLSLVLATGCATPERQVRVASSVASYAKVDRVRGDRAPDFQFSYSDHEQSRLKEIAGRVTVVLLPANAAEWPNPEIYRSCAGLAKALSSPAIRVVIVNVGQPSRESGEVQRALEDSPVQSNQLIMIADHDGDIRRQFGPNASGKFFILDEYLKIAEVGEFTDVAALRKSISHVVDALTEEDASNERSWGD